MKALPVVILLFALALPGCAGKKAAQPSDIHWPSDDPSAAPAKAAWVGEVSRVNPTARFVVLSFPLDRMPVADQRLTVYRHGSKVAEVKVTGPQRGNSIVADIVTGAPEVGDQARAD